MRRLGMSFVVLLWASVAHAQEPPVQEITPEDPAPTPPAPPSPSPSPPPPSKTPEPAQASHLTTMDELTIPKSFLRFGINFFGDASFILTSPGDPVSSFSIGTLGVRMIGELSSSLEALAETAFETTPDEGPLADVEQLAIRWHGGPGELEVGRFHTNIGYWNTAFHHGRWLQMTVERPHVVRFEDDGGLVPVHWVGGAYTLGKKSDRFALVLGVANGRGNLPEDVQVSSDTNEAKAVHVKARVKTDDVEAGVGFIYDRIAAADAMIRPSLPNQRMHEVIANGYFVVRSEGLVAIAEGYAFRHQTTSRSWMSYGGYAHLGYHVTDRVTPYAGVDAVSGADKDPFFHPTPMTANRDLVEAIAGVRVDVSTWSALKLETHLEHSLTTKENEYEGIVNWSFGL